MTRSLEQSTIQTTYFISEEERGMSNAENQLEFKIGEDEESQTVQFSEDGTTGEVLEKEGAPVVETTEKGSSREELESYSSTVQKRIDKLTARLREAERRENAALEYAKNVQAQKDTLEKQFHQTDSARITETRGRIETQILALKQVIRKAREEGDLDTETEAQQRLTALSMDQVRLSEAQQRRAAPPPEQAPQQAPAPRPQAAQLDPRAEEWAERNDWFGKDVVMTSAVRGIHVQLIQNEGFDPSSDEYYDEIDRRMKDLFPERAGARSKQTAQTVSRSNRPVQTVASASRATGTQSARRVVRLTPSQVAIAKRLNVPLEEYAKYVKE
jgi:hypothetical protein